MNSQAAICKSLEQQPWAVYHDDCHHHDDDDDDDQEQSPAKQQHMEIDTATNMLKNQSVWDSPEAFKLFHPTEEDETPKDAIKAKC